MLLFFYFIKSLRNKTKLASHRRCFPPLVQGQSLYAQFGHWGEFLANNFGGVVVLVRLSAIVKDFFLAKQKSLIFKRLF